MSTLVRDDGPTQARIVLIGEAPGASEDATGRPFVGAAGFKLNEWLTGASLRRSDLYVTNCYPYRPTNNKIETVPPAELAVWVDQLHDRIAALDDPFVLVPTGNTALRALIGKAGITKHRGSIYGYQDRHGRALKVIPTIHPAAIFRQPQWERRCLADWRRIGADATFQELRLPEREHFTRPSLADVEGFVADVQANPDLVLAIDIETPGGQIGCVGFATSPAFSITVPTTVAYWQGSLPRVWDAIRELCASHVPKALQNGAYDAFWLAEQDVHLTNWQWDTLAMHHALDPTESHSLAYMASVDTRQPFWKDMRDPKEGDDSGVSWSGAQETLWHYNGIDACVTWELADLYRRRLVEQDRLAFYLRHYQALFQPIQSMMRQGLRLDEQRRRRQYAHLMHRIIMLQDQLATVAGEPLHTTARNKKREAAGKLPGLSNTKIARYLYETLRLPKQTDRSTGSVTTKEVVVRKLMLRHPEKLNVAGTAILDHRRTAKLMEYLDEGNMDEDGRVRCTFKFTTDTGRFASSKSPKGTGRNLQNIDRELRGIFLPEPGCVFLEADLSQAEDRIVKMLAAALTGNQALRDRARAMPWENDEHLRAASIIFKKPVAAVTKAERQIAKPVRHGVNYNEGALTISEVLSKDGLTFTPDECQKALDALHQADPDIRGAWHPEVRRIVMTHRCLTNSWGRMLPFDHERLDDDTYRRAYAFVPQSEVPDLVNQWGLIPVTSWLNTTGRKSVLHLQGHDSLLLSCPTDEVWDVMQFLRTSLERPRIIGREPLTIPVEFKMGRTWAADVEWKRPPSRDEVEAAVRRLT